MDAQVTTDVAADAGVVSGGKSKTTSQLWSRRATLKKRQVAIDQEILAIEEKLRAELAEEEASAVS